MGCIEPWVKNRDTNRIVSWCIVTALVSMIILLYGYWSLMRSSWTIVVSFCKRTSTTHCQWVSPQILWFVCSAVRRLRTLTCCTTCWRTSWPRSRYLDVFKYIDNRPSCGIDQPLTMCLFRLRHTLRPGPSWNQWRNPKHQITTRSSASQSVSVGLDLKSASQLFLIEITWLSWTFCWSELLRVLADPPCSLINKLCLHTTFE